ncbi:MAG: FliI/YscN family ATPase [Phycisphaeraceae bacterium]|nr:MAG: FliI/YscN family ATPase [Phycisphaeraceae bacterium]
MGRRSSGAGVGRCSLPNRWGDGVVVSLRGLTLLVDSLPLPVGSLVSLEPGRGSADRMLGEVVGFNGDRAVVMLFGQSMGVSAGDRVVGEQISQSVGVSGRMLGRCLDGLGRPIDGLGPIEKREPRPINPEPIGALSRRPIREALVTGVRAVDLLTTVGRGQRLGIFAGPGVGKSTLLGQIARETEADVNVIALIGERGREAKEFLEEALGAEGLKRSVVVIATGDESPLLRVRAAKVACTTAEYFREQGRDVLLMMDSVTRFAHAQRQIGLSIGEPPATKGYTPSVFAELPLLLERAGALEGQAGSITGLYTILVEGDDLTGDPISDASRGILDGHVILDRRLAHKGQFPAVDVLDSVSRVADAVTDEMHRAAMRQIKRLMAMYREVEELVQIGAYARGSDAETDVAIEFAPAINGLLRQGITERVGFDQAREALVKIAMQTGESLQQRKQAAQAGKGGRR